MQQITAGKPAKLLIAERRRAILDLIEKEGRVSVETLSKIFRVSSVTVREDLEALANGGSLVRSHGGAIKPDSPVRDSPLSYKKGVYRSEKSRIARRAAQLIGRSQTVIIDSGTTADELAAELVRAPPIALTVITHSLDVALTLAACPSISVTLVGGVLRHISHSFVGPQAEHMLRHLHAEHLFLAVDGFDLEVGLSTPDVLEAQLNALMVRAAREVTVIADSSKFGRRSMSAIGGLECVHRVVTDQKLDPELARYLQERGIDVLLA